MAAMTSELIATITRNERVVTAVEVARDWAIEQHGNLYNTSYAVVAYMHGWFTHNGAINHPEPINDIVEAVWALADLDTDLVDPLTLVDDDFHGTSSDARDHLRRQHERDLQHALNRITWKD